MSSTAAPMELQKLILNMKHLQSNTTILTNIGADSNNESRIHLLRARSGPSKPHKYKIKGISKTLVNIDTKSVANAIAVNDILQQQLGFDIDHTQWSRNISNKSRKFTTDIIVSSTTSCSKFGDNQNKFEWNLIINGYETNIPLSIEMNTFKHVNTNNINEKMNDITIKEQYMEKINKNSMTESMRKQMVQQTIRNKYLILKPKPNQIYKICSEAKWDEVAAENIIADRINNMNNNNEKLRQNGGLMHILSKYLQSDSQQSIIQTPSNLQQIRADANKYIFEGISANQ